MQTLTALLFNDFETLDLFVPIEMFGSLPEYYRLQYASVAGDIIKNKQGVAIQTIAIDRVEYPI